MDKELKYVLKKMCSYVHAEYDNIDFQEDNWYWKYEWTKEQEEDFIEWLTNEIRLNNNVRKQISTLEYRPSKKRSKAFAEHFNMMFGWKTKIEEL